MFVMALSHVGLTGIESTIQYLVYFPQRLRAGRRLGRQPGLKLDFAILRQLNRISRLENAAFVDSMDCIHVLNPPPLIRFPTATDAESRR